MQQQASPPSPGVVVAGYVRRSSEMQKDNYSIDAQKRAIKDACRLRGLPEPIFYEDDERSARGEQIAKRPAFKQLLDDVQAGRVHITVVHTLDRWSRNVMVTLQSFRILSEKACLLLGHSLSLQEHDSDAGPSAQKQCNRGGRNEYGSHLDRGRKKAAITPVALYKLSIYKY